ncbi:MAG: InlB B-repeat-containing protein [Synergistaceae bacterium]|nr:InlB B-repeat-containing protein [Synergistaceae bacterium]
MRTKRFLTLIIPALLLCVLSGFSTGAYADDGADQSATVAIGFTVARRQTATVEIGFTKTTPLYNITVSGGNVEAPSTAKAGDTVTLEYTGDIPAGYVVVYSVNGAAIESNTFTMLSEAVTVAAELTPIEYTITYDLAEGTLADGETNPAAYTVEDSFTLNNPARDGYTFAGWTGTGLDDATLTATIPAGSIGNREYTATWKKNFAPTDPNTPEFAYHSLILSGQIGVIFHVYVPDGASSKDYCVYFDVSGDKSQNTQPVYPFETLNEDGHQFFGFKCYINSVQMADDIHAVLNYGDNESITETYTAKMYLDKLIADTSQSADVIALGKAIKDYGCYVQPILADFNGWSIDVKHASMDAETTYTDSHFETVSNNTKDYALECTVPEDSGIDSLSFALVLDSETAIEIYLATKDGYTGNVAAYVDGGNVNMAVKKGSEYVVSIGNISAHLLGTTHTVSIATQYDNMQEVSFEVKLSALSYVQSAIHDNSTAMKRAVTSIFRYWDATMTYRDNRQDIYGGGE